ncbi:hypothetical protein CSHISOI_09789, partial [Colletotrichum shisoi]
MKVPVVLRGKENFEEWDKSIHQHFSDNGQLAVIIFEDMEPFKEGLELVQSHKVCSEAYYFVLNSIDDAILLALSAHGLIQKQGRPWRLYQAANSLFGRDHEFIASTITKLTEAKFSDFTSTEVFLSYFHLGRICLEEDSKSQTISLLLLNAIKDQYGEVHRTHIRRRRLIWEDLVADLREVDHQEKPDSKLSGRWYQNKSHVYNILTKSLDDVVLSGLEAHGKLHVTPWELYETIRKYCKPTPAESIGLMDKLRDMKISDSPTPAASV